MSNPAQVIRKKRDGTRLAPGEISEFVQLYTQGDIPDYQASAFLMTVYFRGLDEGETNELTRAMLHSGASLNLSDLPGPKLDKHSTGGVGDKTSLVIAPAVAAAGGVVPMISGRGLGHTGGTLDKLEAIPGFRTSLSLEEFRRVLNSCGLGLIGQTAEIAPADRKLYALRDVTATVESIALISASIMSKKLAEGIDGLVLDVKTGSGAFMKTLGDSRMLAESLVAIGEGFGKRVEALITDMSQPLGRAVGNSLEVAECLEVLKGRGPEDLRELCRELSASMLVLGGIAPSHEEGRRRYDAVIAGGSALEKFERVIEAQHGNPHIVEDDSLLPQAKWQERLAAWASGSIVSIDTEAVGWAAMTLGAGRSRLDSVIDPAVGIVFEKKLGDRVQTGETLCTVYLNNASSLPEVMARLRPAIHIGDEPVQASSLIKERIIPASTMGAPVRTMAE
ncbi:MAG: thymidine phosphorylase [Terriglobia bacterium]